MFVLFISSLLVSPWISLILHETGHALAGYSMKMQIREIRLGLGPTIFRTRWFGAEILVGLVPLTGWVRTFPQLRYSKAAMLLFIAAGPVVDLAWFFILIAALQLWGDVDAVRVALFPAIPIQLVLTLANIVPHHARLYGQRLPNDMLALWKTAWTKGDPAAPYRQLYLSMLRAYADFEESSPPLSSRSDRLAYLLFEASSSPRHLSEQQAAALEHELSITPSRHEQLLIMDTIATHILAEETPRNDAYLDRLTEKLLLLAPDLATLKGTRGGALARLGRHEEALTLLAGADDSNDFNRCLNAAFRALAHFHAGRKDQAAAELDIANAILQSQNWADWIGSRIVGRVNAEIGHSLQEPRKVEAGQ